MSDINSPTGFEPAGSLDGSRSMRVGWYDADATTGAIYNKAPVTLAAGGKVSASTAASTNILGSVVAVTWVVDGTVFEGKYYPGNVTGASNLRVGVTDNPYQLYQVQTDGVMAAADVGKNVDIAIPSDAGSELTGLSRVALDISTEGTADAQFRIIGVVDKDDNEVGDDYTDVIGYINQHPYSTRTGV